MSMSDFLPFTTVAIIGAGFSGLGIACQLKKKLNFTDFMIFERASGLGGTWRSNTYPGCGVDVPAVLYSLSFAPNSNFSKLFPDQDEILSYLQRLAVDFNICSSIRYNISCESAKWQEKTGTWLLKLQVSHTGEIIEHHCKVLISAVGRLVVPNSFEIPGRGEFHGQIVHSAQWRSDISVKDKDIIVIGNGCSGSQIVPAIADEAKNVYHFMRPMDRWRFGSIGKSMFQYIPILLKLLRFLVFAYLEMTFQSFSLGQTTQQPRSRVRAKANTYVQRSAPAEYWNLLIPKYALGCKRKILDPGYLESLHRQNVHLTDDRIISLKRCGLVTSSGKDYPADIIIVANGFNSFFYEMSVVGRRGETLVSHWKTFGGIEAYKTTALAGFPNFFLLSGPNSVSGHSSSVFSIESTIDLIVKAVKPVLERHAIEVEVKSEAEQKWVNDVQTALKSRVYADNCATYYVDQKTGWNFTNYPWSFVHLWWSNKFPDMRDWSYRYLD
ncbi:4-hydroxyacetophenone monooxygenase [Hyaloscypha bicolor E]|uniref:4-hydroxyacetophenone monooxygenase n=1 Tax=Hyaloscypha bicolor E TaxID=1095630 RepID=A0A2J6SNK8_9HELO|nr:4-hydroxyacetophenone monooxygenase [Hyaloscypha bicolor E]PMD52338.1 4-hydroxyacetophenone monooxygenase [Hyaloscypha bicolor E]